MAAAVVLKYATIFGQSSLQKVEPNLPFVSVRQT